MTTRRPAKLLEDWLAARAAVTSSAALSPLPTTRALGEKFSTSHGTAFRILCRMEKAGQVWRHPNGRFYPALARRVLGLPKPLAVLLRRMTAWSSLGREVMEGFTEECGARERSILLVHNKTLVQQETPGSSITVAPPKKQREMLEDFLLLHGKAVSGVLLEETWSDRALSGTFPAGLPAAVFYRSTNADGLGQVAADFSAGALLALGHLLACRYDRILLLNPIPAYEPATAFLRCAREVYADLVGQPFPQTDEIVLYPPEERESLLRSLSATKGRWGLICPEDNVCLSFSEEMRARGLVPGVRHGLLTVMGTRAAAPLTAVRYDFTRMGREAARMLCEGATERTLIAPELVAGETTRRQ